MSRVLGIDLDTRALHLVLVDDDTGRAEYHPCPFVGHKPPFRFVDARNVRPRLNEVMAASSQDGWDDVWLCGVERPYAQGRGTAYTYGLLTGAILAAIPSRVCVLELPPQEWRQLCGMGAKASKDDVRAWALGADSRGRCVACGEHAELDCVACDVAAERSTWPQDAHDALAIAHAARRLNAKGIAA